MLLLLIPRFWKWEEKHDNILKRWTNSAALNKSLKIIGRKLIISNFKKMRPLLNASKEWQTVPAGSFKARTI